MSPLNRFHMYSGDTQPYSFLELLGDLRVVLLQGNDAVGAHLLADVNTYALAYAVLSAANDNLPVKLTDFRQLFT